MEKDALGYQKMMRPLYYQKSKRKVTKKKNSSDNTKARSIKSVHNKFVNNSNNNYIESYKRNQSPMINNINSNLSYKVNKINSQNDSYEKINLNFKNISSLFNINTSNIIDLPNFNKEKIIDFNIYTPFINENNLENNDDIDNNLEEELSPLYKYGLRYINYDIYNNKNNKYNKILLIQSWIRGFILRKKLNLNLINKSYLEGKNVKLIIFIQKNIKAFLAKLRIRKKLIMNYITQSRKNAINIIIDNMRSYNNILKTKKLLFIKNKIEERNKYAKYIQEFFRNYKFYISFKRLMKEMNEKYFIVYPCKGNKVELILYSEEKNNLIPKKYNFSFNKLLKCFVLFISPSKLYAGKYKCQFVIDDIVICDKNYPYIQYKNELYNIIEFKLNKKKKLEKRKKTKSKTNINANKNRINNNNNNIKGNIKKINYNKMITNVNKNYKNNFYQKEEYDKLEDIKEEEDEGKSTTSKDNINESKYMKNNNRENLIDDLDFTEEDIMNIKKLKGNKKITTDYQKLREELLDKKPINKGEKIRKASFKSFNFNY